MNAMSGVNRLDTVDPMTDGRRALDEKTDELLEKVGADQPYDLVMKGQRYPWTDENTPENRMPAEVEPGEHQKGLIQLAGVDVLNEHIDLFYSSTTQFEREAVERASKMRRSLEQVNLDYGTDWSATLYIKPEKPVYNVPESKYGQGVAYTPATLDTIKESEAFADLSRGHFGGWLELSPGEMLEP
ncbi:MAG: hypothetical protein ABEI58_04005 [Candidatus Nanohaloarchaea archaeon]